MLFAVLASLAPLTPAAPPGERIVVTPVKRIEAVETCTVRGPKLAVTFWTLMAVRPPELPGQRDTSVTIVPGVNRSLLELSPLRRPVVEVRLPVQDPKLRREITVEVKYRATLLSRKLMPVPVGAKVEPARPLPERDRKAFLAAASLLDHDVPRFRRWLADTGLHRQEREDDVSLARRIYTHLRKNYTYRFDEAQDRHASVLCTKDATDCGGQAALFVSALRANSVPARVLVGRRAQSMKKDDKADDLQVHVRAEFHADGIGWVPVDPAFGLFGEEPGDFLVLHLDYGLIYDTRILGRKTLTLVQKVGWWGVGPGSFDGSTETYAWQVRELPR
ncbi:MAG: transglutaminase domain-containing protein [Planctomycetes bacterium]|nr:transglutaminase domain-containing protein [Planctomycetota bacterium]